MAKYFFRVWAATINSSDADVIALTVECDDYELAEEVAEEYEDDLWEQRLCDYMDMDNNYPVYDEYEDDETYIDALTEYENKMAQFIVSGHEEIGKDEYMKLAADFEEDYIVAQPEEDEDEE